MHDPATIKKLNALREKVLGKKPKKPKLRVVDGGKK